MKRNAHCEAARQAIQIKKVRGDIKKMNQTNDRQSLEKLSESCSSNKDNEVKDRDPISQADLKTVDDENPRYP